MLRKSLAFAAALALSAAPALAQSSASPLSVTRAGADTDQASDLRGGNLFPMAVFATIVLLGVLTAFGVIFDDDDPDSP